MKKKNVVNQRQFRAGYIPQEHSSPEDAASVRHANPPSDRATKCRQGVGIGSQTQANPGLAAWRSKGSRRGK